MSIVSRIYSQPRTQSIQIQLRLPRRIVPSNCFYPPPPEDQPLFFCSSLLSPSSHPATASCPPPRSSHRCGPFPFLIFMFLTRCGVDSLFFCSTLLPPSSHTATASCPPPPRSSQCYVDPFPNFYSYYLQDVAWISTAPLSPLSLIYISPGLLRGNAADLGQSAAHVLVSATCLLVATLETPESLVFLVS